MYIIIKNEATEWSNKYFFGLHMPSIGPEQGRTRLPVWRFCKILAVTNFSWTVFSLKLQNEKKQQQTFVNTCNYDLKRRFMVSYFNQYQMCNEINFILTVSYFNQDQMYNEINFTLNLTLALFGHFLNNLAPGRVEKMKLGLCLDMATWRQRRMSTKELRRRNFKKSTD